MIHMIYRVSLVSLMLSISVGQLHNHERKCRRRNDYHLRLPRLHRYFSVSMILFQLMVTKNLCRIYSLSLHLDPIIDINANTYPTPQLVEYLSAYVNEDVRSSNQSDNDDFYVIPRQEHPPICDTYHSLPDENSSSDASNQFYAAPLTFAKNFVLESNLSFDDRQDISLDTVPDVIIDPSASNNTVYYSYPDHQPITVNIRFVFFRE